MQYLKKFTKILLFIYIVVFTVTTSTNINRFALMLLTCVGGLYILCDRSTVKQTTFIVAMIAYGCFLLASKIYTISPAYKVNVLLVGYVSMLIPVLIAVAVIDDEKDIKYILNAFVVAVIFQFVNMMSIYGVDFIRVIGKSEELVRIGNEESNANSVGMSFIYGALIAFNFLLYGKPRFFGKIFYAAVSIIGFVVGLMSGSRKVLVMLFIGIFIIMLVKKRDSKNVIKQALVLMAAGLVFYIAYYVISENEIFSVVSERFTALIDGLLGKGELDYSSNMRFKMMEIGFEAFLEKPILGNGVYSSYAYFGTYSHNNFVEILMNTGIAGFIIFYMPYYKNLKAFIKTDKKDNMYGIMLFLILWILFGGFGMITYYSKYEMVLMAVVTMWLKIKGERV